jgi:hypothetical protein
MEVHELIGLNEYFNNRDVWIGEQVEIGSETIALCLNHKIINGWSTKNILVNYKDIADNNVVDKLAYLSDIPSEFVSSINGISGVSTILCADYSINVNNGTNIISLSANVGVKPLNNLTNDITFICKMMILV